MITFRSLFQLGCCPVADFSDAMGGQRVMNSSMFAMELVGVPVPRDRRCTTSLHPSCTCLPSFACQSAFPSPSAASVVILVPMFRQRHVALSIVVLQLHLFLLLALDPEDMFPPRCHRQCPLCSPWRAPNGWPCPWFCLACLATPACSTRPLSF